MRLLRTLLSLLIINLRVDANLWLIFTPLSYEELILVMIKVTALTFALTVDPVAFKMVSISFRKNTITVAFSFVPLTFINVFVRVDHTSFSLGMSIDPVSIVTIVVCIEECSTSMTTIFIPVTSILTAKLATVISPESALTVFLINSPHSFILISVLVVLDSEAFLTVVAPVSNIARGTFPLLTLNSPVLLLVLLLNPVD